MQNGQTLQQINIFNFRDLKFHLKKTLIFMIKLLKIKMVDGNSKSTQALPLEKQRHLLLMFL